MRTTKKRLISSGSTFEVDAAYSRAVVVDDWVFVAGTTGFDYSNMTISDDIVEQTEQCLRNIQSALAQAGSSIDDVVRVHYILPVMEDYAFCQPILRNWFCNIRPAATTIAAGLLDSRMRIEIEVTALKQKQSKILST